MEGVIEAAGATQRSILSESAFRNLKKNLKVKIGPDLGIGDPVTRKHLQELLNEDLHPSSVAHGQFQQLIPQCECNYLSRWCSDVGEEFRPIERTARSISGYILDSEISGKFAADLIMSMVNNAGQNFTAKEIVLAIEDVIHRPLSVFQAVCVFEKAPLSKRTQNNGWLSSHDAADWLTRHGFSTEGLRIAGALRVEVRARDQWRASQISREAFQRVIARATIGSWVDCKHYESIWIAGANIPHRFSEDRGVVCPTLHRNDSLYADGRDDSINNALELLGTLNNGPRGPAVTSGWTALETLLTTPSDAGQRVCAAERAGVIAACSFARAELTKLSYVHEKEAPAGDALAASLGDAESNRERARLVANILVEGGRICTRRAVDEASVVRLNKLLESPNKSLRDIASHVGITLNRFYLVRNLITHGGVVDSRSVETQLRAASPLIGAVIDRIVSYSESEGLDSISLAARAMNAISLSETVQRNHIVDLLEQI